MLVLFIPCMHESGKVYINLLKIDAGNENASALPLLTRDTAELAC